MTVSDLQKELEKAGLESSINNGILTISRGDFDSISITNGKTNDSSAASCNLVSAFQMFQNESGDLETAILDFNRGNNSSSSSSSGGSANTDAEQKSILERILTKILD